MCFCAWGGVGDRGGVGWLAGGGGALDPRWFTLLTVLGRWSRCWYCLRCFVVYSARQFVLCLAFPLPLGVCEGLRFVKFHKYIPYGLGVI